MKTAILNIVRMPLVDVNHPHPKNPRDIPPDDSEEIRVLDASLAHDYFDPVVWNRRNGLLVSGHVRVPRLLALGFTHADVSVAPSRPPWSPQGSPPVHRSFGQSHPL